MTEEAKTPRVARREIAQRPTSIFFTPGPVAYRLLRVRHKPGFAKPNPFPYTLLRKKYTKTRKKRRKHKSPY